VSVIAEGFGTVKNLAEAIEGEYASGAWLAVLARDIRASTSCMRRSEPGFARRRFAQGGLKPETTATTA
jgi:hypothetical protein